jgi:NTE family protein
VNTVKAEKSNENRVLVLQGGGALGAYQAGAYTALHEAGYEPHWLAGISIGSINAALIAGNSPAERVDKLHRFWSMVSTGLTAPNLLFGEYGRTLYNEMSAAKVVTFGVDGFFKPRLPTEIWKSCLPGARGALSIYDTSALRQTLLNLVDFDRLNHNGIRVSFGAVNVRTGNFVYFDSAKIEIKPEHIMASSALPEGFPPIEIDGEWYWDGGLVSNTPLQYVIDQQDDTDMCVFQVDLFPAAGALPANMRDVVERQKDIRFSSRTRLNTDIFRNTQEVRRIVKRLLEKFPDELRRENDYALLKQWSCNCAVTIAHLIYRQKSFESNSKDYEFSRLSMNEHWRSGEEDVNYLLQQKDWVERETPTEGVRVFDYDRSSLEQMS